ncbi:MAG: phosphate signaling complex protein PhoU [Gammaproteobacteria bacterium]|nr:phosphate signaling complex protein PhoU [Gammaproteobacteria bacterium]
MSQPLEEGHTIKRFDAELSHIIMLALEMGAMVLNQVRSALDALRNADLSAARQVIDVDYRVNALELQADEEIVSVIARRGPVARDLRLTIGISKALTDMERIGDEAAKIARMTEQMYETEGSQPGKDLKRDIYGMGKLATGLLQEVITAFDMLDADKAQQLALGGTEMDAEFESSLRRIATFIMEDHRTVGHAVDVVIIIKSLERIGDHARNIAEQVVYMVRGTDMRHLENGAKTVPGAARNSPPKHPR